ncbi:methylated-DNA--[protein]-cysteine S-methyltransferase [bacterium]|nr:methylated-DNA--[protein]-cysteine S-methyltransferase [bacterium]MBU1982832.1 methylated-DNA--[protein]-cysteine S-methyltransferase [bacterium]
MQTIPREVKLKALYARDPNYAGLFYTAVKTTGIFCRIGCPVRFPKPENVLFFDTVKAALDAGFRPCKVCKPLEHGTSALQMIHDLLSELHAKPQTRITDSDLRRRGISPEMVRRWFKKHHGITFQAYQRYLKIGNAIQRLKSGENVSTVAFESHNSLSGFQDSFKNALGVSPKASTRKTVIVVTRLPTPLGPMMACAVNDELCLFEFCDRRMLATELDEIRKRLGGVLITGHCQLFDELRGQLDEYFRGERREFSLTLKLAGTPFQESVWHALLTIPYGSTRSYQEQAKMIGRPDAVRAVARANGQNRIAIIVPCHRVIGKDGGLTGYGGGLERKEWLLNHERQHTS